MRFDAAGLRGVARVRRIAGHGPEPLHHAGRRREVGVAGAEVRFAWGYGGQYIFVVPDRDLVVAVTSSIRDERENYKRAIFGLLERTIQYAGT